MLPAPDRRNPADAAAGRAALPGRVLDPATAPQELGRTPPLPTAYVGPAGAHPSQRRREAIEERSTPPPKALGWTLTFSDEDPRTRSRVRRRSW
jgi:hypothetical protein